MQAAEGFVLLVDGPRLSIEFDFDDVLRIGAMINLVLHHSCLRDLDLQRNLEEYGAIASTVFRALLHMVDESLRWEEYVAELALHRDRMLEHSLIDLDRVDFLRQLSVSILDV